MEDQGTARADDTSPFYGFDERLLRHMATSIQTAHAANPRCWALSRTTVGSIPLHIHATLVLTIRQAGGDFLVLGSCTQVSDEGLREIGIQGGDRCVLNSLTADQFDRAYTSLRERHEALIADRAPVVETRPMRADGHSQALVEELSRILGISLPAPLYLLDDSPQVHAMSGSAGQASRLPSNYENLSDEVKTIYDALSEEGKAAVTALPDDLFTDPEGVDRSEWFLDSLRLAHAGSPACWALMGGPGAMGGHGSMLLTIGTKNVISMRDKMRFVVFRDLVREDKLEGGFQHYISYDAYKFRDDIVQVEVDLETPAGALSELERAHQQTIIRLAIGRIGSQGRNHKDDSRVKLALVTGEFVPAPSYVPESTYGLPNGLRIVERAGEGQRTAVTGTAHATTPGLAIYDAISPQGKAAVDALPDDQFMDDEGVDRSGRFIRSIRIVNAGKPELWSMLTFASEKTRKGVKPKLSVTLNVQDFNMITLGREHHFVIQRDLVDEGRLGIPLQDLISWDKYAKRPELVQVRIPSVLSPEAVAELERVHELVLHKLVNENWQRNLQARNHRDDMRVKLAQVTGEDVPAPGYVPRSTLGLPNGLRIAARGKATVSAQEQGDLPIRHAVITVDVPSMLPQGFASAGLTYTHDQIASFYTALQTKGFVILSGISGTGKSKIAQRIADMLPSVRTMPETVLAEDWVRVAVRPYMKKHKRIRLLNKISGGLPVPSPGISIVVPFSLDGENGKCRVWTRPEAGAGTYLFPQGDIGDKVRETIEDSFALRFKTLDDDSGIESIEMVTELPLELNLPHDAAATPNHLFLPVRPDWRDGKALIGYHNPLTGEYVRTDFLEFVIAAADDYRAGNCNAFFVILDEMNLAHVEYYFADVLSVIESGRFTNGHLIDNQDMGGWTVEGIPLAVGEEDADLPERLHLPPNLYIVGTVNMDETTHPFSPKVLDRAFTIELTEVDFSSYPPGDVAGDAALSDGERQALLDAFTQNGCYPRIDKDDIRGVVADHPRFRADLASLNTSLKRYRMHFGYRVFDEIMQFVHNAEANGMFSSPDDAFDHAVLMKVLPKFNGSLAKLERALLELIVWSRQSIEATSDDMRAVSAKFAGYVDKGTSFDTLVLDAEDWRYPATGRRAALMMQDLYTDGFAAFG